MEQPSLLTAASPRAAHPPSDVALKPHQLAILHAALEAEARGDYGLLADLPGAGKTYCMVALIYRALLEDPTCGPTVIVVPDNIYTQWCESVRAFCGDAVRVKPFTTYGDITSLYFDTHVLTENDVLVTTPLYLPVLTETMGQMGLRVHRAVFDEIDSVNYLFRRCQIKATHVWQVSATAGNFLTSSSHRTTVIKCADDFVKRNFALEAPEFRTLLCVTPRVIGLFNGLLSRDQVQRFHSLDYTLVHCNCRVVKDDAEAIAVLMRHMLDDAERIAQLVAELEGSNATGVHDARVAELREQRETLEANVELVRTRLRDNELCVICYAEFDRKTITPCCQRAMCYPCIAAWVNAKRSARFPCPVCRASVLLDDLVVCGEVLLRADEAVVPRELYPDKLAAFRSLLTSLPEDSKVLVYAGYDACFASLGPIVASVCRCADLDQGNVRDIDAVVKGYRDGGTRVLLASAVLFSAGLNLENTTDVVVMSRLDPSLDRQIVGRAQRPGRTSRLRVHFIEHEAEHCEGRDAMGTL